MTENELKAVRFIKSIKNHAMVTLDHIAKEEPNVSPLFYKGREEKADTILAMVEELKQYRVIGTPEECRAAERNSEKTRIIDGITECCGYDFGIDAFQRELSKFCPVCGRKIERSDEE